MQPDLTPVNRFMHHLLLQLDAQVNVFEHDRLMDWGPRAVSFAGEDIVQNFQGHFRLVDLGEICRIYRKPEEWLRNTRTHF